MTYTAEHRAGQVKTQIPDVAELVVDIITEQVQKEHIEEYVQESAVQKRITYKLPQLWPNCGEHKLMHPGPKFQVTCRAYLVFQKKNERIDSYQRVIRVWCLPRPNTCPIRKYHSSTNDLVQDFCKTSVSRMIKIKGWLIVMAKSSDDKT